MNSRIYSLLHNEAIRFILNNLKNIPLRNEVERVVKELNSEFFRKYGIHFRDYSLPPFPENPNNVNLREWITQSPQSDELKFWLNKTIDVLEAQKDYLTTQDDLHNLEVNAKNRLNHDDFVIYSDHIFVAISSIQYWTSKIEGEFVWKLDIRNFNPDPPAAINWWKVFGCDCIGGIVTGTPVGYAGASAISVIMQL